jgi:hypothetical protein
MHSIRQFWDFWRTRRELNDLRRGPLPLLYVFNVAIGVEFFRRARIGHAADLSEDRTLEPGLVMLGPLRESSL